MLEIQNVQDRSVLHGQLYSNLDDLVEEGYIEKSELDGRTNYYSITDEGIGRLWKHHEWERELLEMGSNGDAE